MLIVGLTGSIGMGKSTVANYLAGQGVPVLDADSVVHRLYEGEAVPHIEAAFPGTTADGKVDRGKLSAVLMQAPSGFARLEALVHPLVYQAQWHFLRDQAAKGAALCVLDIPLLFETGGNELVDVSIAVSAPEDAQTERVLARPGMTAAKLAAIKARLLSDAEKRARADFVIDTGVTWGETQAAVDKLFESLKTRPGGTFERWRAKYERQ